jgi:CheY-like chemotaxis protein
MGRPQAHAVNRCCPITTRTGVRAYPLVAAHSQLPDYRLSLGEIGPIYPYVRKRILFVDDDVSLLTGLRNVLRRENARWEMVFVVGGEAALAELRAAPFDVVISDLRMPGIDGVALLERVRASSPCTRRIMLSGSADEEEVNRASHVVDLLLTKPCQTSTLRAAIEHMADDRVALVAQS